MKAPLRCSTALTALLLAGTASAQTAPTQSQDQGPARNAGAPAGSSDTPAHSPDATPVQVPTPAVEQTGIGDIIVTAERRNESL